MIRGAKLVKNSHAKQISAEGSFVGCASICIALTQFSNKFYIKSGDEVGAIDIVSQRTAGGPV